MNLVFRSNVELAANPTLDRHIVTKSYVDTRVAAVGGTAATHVANASIHVPAMNATGYAFLSNADSDSPGTWTAYGTGAGAITAGGASLVTGGAVHAYIEGLALADTYAAKVHEHSGADITSGTVSADRLPSATTSARGVVQLGTSEGTVPVLGAGGKLDSAVIPSVAIQDRFEAADEAAMLALSGARNGDLCVRSDTGKVYMLVSSAAYGYATLANWKEIIAATPYIMSVNGYTTQAVTLGYSDVGAVGADALATSVSSASTDAGVPTAKAVYDFVDGGYSRSGHAHAGLRSLDGADYACPEGMAGSGLFLMEQGAVAPAYSSEGTYSVGDLVAANGALYKCVSDVATPGPFEDNAASFARTSLAAASRYDALVSGDGTATDFTVTHGLGRLDVFVQVVDNQDRLCLLAVQFLNKNQLKLCFDTAPEVGESFRVLVKR